MKANHTFLLMRREERRGEEREGKERKCSREKERGREKEFVQSAACTITEAKCARRRQVPRAVSGGYIDDDRSCHI